MGGFLLGFSKRSWGLRKSCKVRNYRGTFGFSARVPMEERGGGEVQEFRRWVDAEWSVGEDLG